MRHRPKRPGSERAPAQRPSPDADSRAIDALYGLEPVFEPGREADAASASTRLQAVDCPYCGERFQSLIDPSAGSAHYIEDCQVCCQPIEFELRVEADGAVSLQTRRDG